MITVRIFFQKVGLAKYISHLDVNRCMQRALKRAQLPVWYTQGFNPHIFVTFALPLPLGTEGLCESMDVKLTEDDYPMAQLVERLNAVLPQGFVALDAAVAQKKPGDIALADYTITLQYPGYSAAQLYELWQQFWANPQLLVEKQGKKGSKTVDLKKMIATLQAGCNQQDETLRLQLRCHAGGQSNLNPSLLVQAFASAQNFGTGRVEIQRTGIYTQTGEIFR